MLKLATDARLGGIAPELVLRRGLDGPLGPANGADAGDGDVPEVGAVSVLGDQVGNGLVGPVKGGMSAFPCSSLGSRFRCSTDLREVLLPP